MGPIIPTRLDICCLSKSNRNNGVGEAYLGSNNPVRCDLMLVLRQKRRCRVIAMPERPNRTDPTIPCPYIDT
jgi:hypothetical protein